MARHILGLRKQRTREHVIADQSLNHVERLVIDEGFTAQRLDRDYGYDLELTTYDAQGYVEPGSVFLQLKASEQLEGHGADYVYDIDIRDYNLWTREVMPVFLILFEAARRRAFWLHVQSYFNETSPAKPRKGAKTVRARIPMRQKVTRRTVVLMRTRKQELLDRVERL